MNSEQKAELRRLLRLYNANQISLIEVEAFVEKLLQTVREASAPAQVVTKDDASTEQK